MSSILISSLTNGYSYDWCNPTNTQSLSATVNGNSITGSISTCYGVATFTGTISGSSIYGAWTGSQVGDAFSGSGTFSAARVQLSGKYAGTLYIFGSYQDVTVGVSETSSGTVSAIADIGGTGEVKLYGTAVGNCLMVHGTEAGTEVSLVAWVHNPKMIVADSSGGYLGLLYKE